MKKRVTADSVAKQAQNHSSDSGEELKRYLGGVVLLGGEGSITVDPGEDVYIAIMHDGGGFNPGAVICVEEYGHPDTALEGAYELLYEKELTEAIEDGRMAELEAEWTEYEGQATDILIESFDGMVWTLPAHEAAEIISQSSAAKYINIDMGEEQSEVDEYPV